MLIYYTMQLKKNIFELASPVQSAELETLGVDRMAAHLCERALEAGFGEHQPICSSGKPPSELPRHALLTGIQLFSVTNFVMAL